MTIRLRTGILSLEPHTIRSRANSSATALHMMPDCNLVDEEKVDLLLHQLSYSNLIWRYVMDMLAKDEEYVIVNLEL